MPKLPFQVCLGTVLAIFSSSFAVRGAENRERPALEYHFDSDPGSTVHDWGDGTHDGTIVHGAYLPNGAGKSGALRLDGKDSYIDCGELRSLRLQGDSTFEMWVRQNGPTQTPWGLVFGQIPIDSFHFSLAYGNTLVLFYRTNREEALLTLAPRSLLGAEWAHIAMVVEYPRCRFYRDGKLVRDCYMAAPAIERADSGHFCIGGGPDGKGGHAPIDLAGFRVYRRALSAQEVAADAKNETIAFHPTAELAAEPDWYAETLGLRLSWKNETAPVEPAQFEVAPTGLGQAPRTLRAAWAESSPGSGRYVARVTLPIEGLEGQTLKARAWLGDDRTGAEIASRNIVLKQPDWIKNGEGISNTVLKPWTALTAKSTQDGAVELQVWNRRYVFGSHLFPETISSGGHALLTGPIALRGQIDGKPATWDEAKVNLQESSDLRAEVASADEHGPVALRVETKVEYDGYAIFDCKLEARQDTELQGLDLDIPLQTKYAGLCYGSNVLPMRDGVLLTQHYSGAVRGDLAFHFSPNIFLGDEERGLCWQAESDEDWDESNREKAIEILPRGETTFFRAHWIGAPVHLHRGQTLHYRFALLATPIKPLVRDSWNLRVARSEPYGLDLSLPDRKTAGVPTLQHYVDLGIRRLFINGSDVWPWPMPQHESYAEPLHRLIDAIHAAGLKAHPYLIHQRFPIDVPEFDGYGAQIGVRPYKQYIPASGPPDRPGMISFAYGADSQGTMFFCPESPAAQDAWIHSLAQRLKEFGDNGVYLDGTVHIVPCDNAEHGCGYEKNGQRHTTYPMFAIREFMRRIYTVVHEHDPDGVVDAHCSWGYNLSALAYSDIMWTGEQWYQYRGKGSPFIPDDLTLDKFRTEFTGRQIGVAADTLTYRLGLPMKVAAVALLHDISPRMSTTDIDSLSKKPDQYNSLLPKIWQMRDRFDAEHARKLYYWNNHDYVQVTPAACYATLLRHPKNGVLALVSNLSHSEQTVQVKLGLDALGWTGVPLEASEPLSSRTVAVDAAGRLSVVLPSLGWTYILIRPAAGTPVAIAPLEVKLWADQPPGYVPEAGPEAWEKGDSISNINIPSLAVHLPDRTKATGLAFIVCPGGSYTKVGRFSTGSGMVEDWVPRGAAVIVLKYRTRPPSLHVEDDALADARRALRLVRSRASEWGIDPRKIGMVGTSAGSNLILNLLSHEDQGNSAASDPVERESCRPAFAALLCPWPDQKTMEDYPLAPGTPPIFIASALDDRIAPHAFAASLADACRRAQIPAELWTIAKGGHTAFSPGQKGEGAAWPRHFEKWLVAQGVVPAANGLL